MDPWIIGDSPDSGRTYIVHAAHPRFIVEMIEQRDGSWKAAEMDAFDEMSAADAAEWVSSAADMFLRWIQVGSPLQ